MLLVGFVLAGLSFPAMFWRADERPLIAKAMRLDLPATEGTVEWSDSLQEGWDKLDEPGRWTHDVKGIANRWFQENHKVAFKGSAFVILVLTTLLVL